MESLIIASICYLSNRKQVTVLNNQSSQFALLTTGVPKGSTLGPLLFLDYIKYIVKSSSVLKFIIFADDTNINLSGTETASLNQIINLELKLVTKWLYVN